jgi:hypothetical protein
MGRLKLILFFFNKNVDWFEFFGILALMQILIDIDAPTKDESIISNSLKTIANSIEDGSIVDRELMDGSYCVGGSVIEFVD